MFKNQKSLNKMLARTIIVSVFVVLFVIVFLAIQMEKQMQGFVEVNESQSMEVTYNNQSEDHQTTNLETEKTKPVSTTGKVINKVKNPFLHQSLSSEDSYLLAKIAMAEAEDGDYETKAAVIFVVLNRVQSDEFPDTVKEVIFQVNNNGVYQFTPIVNGRWDKVEPNMDCYKALDIVFESEYDLTSGALYFESCKNENNWHNNNLEFICKFDKIRFYK